MFLAASAVKNVISLVDAVGDQDMKPYFICILPLRQILPFSLWRHQYMFNFIKYTNFAGIIWSPVSAFLCRIEVPFSNNPVISDLMAFLNLSLIKENIIRIYIRLLGSGLKSDRLTCLSISISSSFLIWFSLCARFKYSCRTLGVMNWW